MLDDYKAFKEAMRGEFNARFDKQSTVLRRALDSDEYDTHRALCFGWYLTGFLDALTGGEGAEVIEGLEDAAEGRTTPLEVIRARLKKSETVH